MMSKDHAIAGFAIAGFAIAGAFVFAPALVPFTAIASIIWLSMAG